MAVVSDYVPLPAGSTIDADGNIHAPGLVQGRYEIARISADGLTVEEVGGFDSREPGTGGGGLTLPQTNVADVSSVKRIQVVNDIAASVAGGGQAMILESDTTYAGKKFKDNRTANAPYFYECFQEANPSTGATETWWNRFRIQ